MGPLDLSRSCVQKAAAADVLSANWLTVDNYNNCHYNETVCWK